jgi:hypothetical protein
MMDMIFLGVLLTWKLEVSTHLRRVELICCDGMQGQIGKVKRKIQHTTRVAPNGAHWHSLPFASFCHPFLKNCTSNIVFSHKMSSERESRQDFCGQPFNAHCDQFSV